MSETPTLSPRHRAVLAAVCDTLLPELPPAEDPAGLFAIGARTARTAERAESLIAALADPRDRQRLDLLLTALDSRLANLLLGGRFASFLDLPRAAREAVLREWAGSRLPPRRAGFQALKRLVHVAYYCWPVTDGSHPSWRAAGYPGPLPLPTVIEPPLPTLSIERDTTLDCDAVIVGSGAGGGVVAGVLAQAGLDVVVLEKGRNPGPRDLTQIEGDMLGSLYLDGGLMMTQSGSLPILAGSCLGGGTAINYTTSFPLPEAARAEWDRRSGLSLFAGPGFAESLTRVSARLNVGTQWTTPGVRDQLLERGCRALGWHVGTIPRNVTGCREGLECGYCGYGCRHGAKNSTARTYLRDAAQSGARLVVECEVERVLSRDGRASGISGWARDATGRRHAIIVRAPIVVAACGAVNTPALLHRSGLASARLGRGLRLHPSSGVVGFFPQRVEPWSGALQTRYSDQFAHQDDGYGAKFETVPVHFALPSSGFGWHSARQHRADLSRLAQMSLVGILLRDRDPGRITFSPAGRPRVHYELSRFDAGHMRVALRGAAQVLAAAGAEEIVTLHTPPVRVRPGEAGWLERFTAAADARGFRRCRMSYISFHQMGGAAMAADGARGVADETGQVRELPGLYVADGSTFPAASGVNPMITIMAIADHVARGIAAKK